MAVDNHGREFDPEEHKRTIENFDVREHLGRNRADVGEDITDVELISGTFLINGKIHRTRNLQLEIGDEPKVEEPTIGETSVG